MLNSTYLFGAFFLLTMNSYATNQQEAFEELWRKNTTTPSYKYLFFDGKDVFLKDKQKEEKSKFDHVFQKNVQTPHYETQDVLSIDHKGETITIKKKENVLKTRK